MSIQGTRLEIARWLFLGTVWLLGARAVAQTELPFADRQSRQIDQLERIAVRVAPLPAVASSGDLPDRHAADDRDSAARPVARADEEVLVQGDRTLAAWRAALDAARDQAMSRFNEINSSDRFDIHCRNEIRTGTHIPARICRPRFQHEVATDAAREWLAALRSACLTVNSSCIFGVGANEAMSRAQAVESESRYLDDRLAEEILRLANEDPEFARALLDYDSLRRAYKAARQKLRD